MRQYQPEYKQRELKDVFDNQSSFYEKQDSGSDRQVFVLS